MNTYKVKKLKYFYLVDAFKMYKQSTYNIQNNEGGDNAFKSVLDPSNCKFLLEGLLLFLKCY